MATKAPSLHSSTLPREFHGATNDSRTDAPDATVASIDADKEMVINGRVYDVSSFVKRHPGGSVIKFQLGADASDAYNNFHVRSKKADKMLNSLPSRAADAGYEQDALSQDFEKLRLELRAEGYFEPNLVHVAFRCLEVVAIYWAGVQLIWSGYWFLGAIVMGIAQGRCGWLQHEGGHYSLTGNIKVDRHLQMAIYGLGCGMSGCYWRNQHNKHHATPQKLGTDPDLQTMPLVAFHKIVGSKAEVRTHPNLRPPPLERCSVLISNSQAVSLNQRVLMTLVLRLIMNDGFSFGSSITCSELVRVSWVNLG